MLDNSGYSLLLMFASLTLASPFALDGSASLEIRASNTKYFFTLYLLRHLQSFKGSGGLTDERYSGDSYSQTGFDPSSTHPSSSNPIGNPIFPGYTTSGGKNWLGQVIATYNTSLTLDWNFAYGGATVDPSLVAPYTNTVKCLTDQVKEFKTYVASRPSYAPWTSHNSLFAIWLGVNDVGNSYGEANESILVNEILIKYFEEVQILYNSGARHFLFLTVPPINRTPLMLSQSSSAQSLEASVISNFNSVLQSKAAAFKSSTGSLVWVVDTQRPFTTALNNPTAYGAPNNYCYNSDGKSCLWWNNYHPGIAIQNLVAEAVVSALKGSIF